jgi:hypothetical protein
VKAQTVDALTKEVLTIPLWHIGLLALVVIVLVILKKGRIALCAVIVLAYYHVFRAFWPDVSVESEGIIFRAALVIAVGIGAGLLMVYLLVIKGK